MRKNFIRVFAAAALTLSFAACSQNDIVPDNGVITPEMATSYAKVKISMAGGSSTRAGEDGTFAEGKDNEVAINSLTLLLYSDEGALVGKGSTTESISLTDGTANSVDKKTEDNAAIVKVTLEPGSAIPTKMLVYVNNTDVSYESLDAAHKALVEKCQEGQGTNASDFVMTNALNSNFDEVAVDVDLDKNFGKDEEEAETKTAVDVYVERLAARITVQEASSVSQDVDFTIKGVDGETEYTLNFTAKRWAPTGTAKQMYSLKQAWEEDFGKGTEFGSVRSYWAKGYYYDTKYDAYIATGDNTLNYLSANQILYKDGEEGAELGAENYLYANEHTFGNAAKNGTGADVAFSPKLTGTNAIIVGQYSLEGNDVDRFKITKKIAKVDTEVYDFYLALSSKSETNGKVFTIYSEKDLITYLVNKEKTFYKDTEGNILTKEDYAEYFELDKNDKKQYIIVLKSGKTIYEKNEDTSEYVASTDFSKVSNAAHYMYGYAYFLAPIKHNPDGDDMTVGTYGVVRNHAYALTIQAINSLGAPLDEDQLGEDPEDTEPTPGGEDPGDEPIIPDPDEIKDVWINTTINVLKWHVVSQGVTL